MSIVYHMTMETTVRHYYGNHVRRHKYGHGNWKESIAHKQQQTSAVRQYAFIQKYALYVYINTAYVLQFKSHIIYSVIICRYYKFIHIILLYIYSHYHTIPYTYTITYAHTLLWCSVQSSYSKCLHHVGSMESSEFKGERKLAALNGLNTLE